MPGCFVSATTASFRSVEKRRLRATPVITSTLENVSDIGTCLGLSLGPPGYRRCPVQTGCTPIPQKADATGGILSGRLASAIVKGFGCRPIRNLIAGTE